MDEQNEWIDGLWRPPPGALDGDPTEELWRMEFEQIVQTLESL